MLETIVPMLLAIQGILGAADTLINHELIERLPQRREARAEVGLHALREMNYGLLFAGFAWFEWHGLWALAIAGLVAGEVAITAIDEYVENHVRVLPHNERVMHVFLTLNLGLIIAALLPTTLGWLAQPTALIPRSHGWLSWLLSVLALAGIAWSVRDALAWRRLRWGAQYPGIRGA